MQPSNPVDRSEELSLEAAASHMLEECRMVLPGVQALFGFQFVAVFNQAFSERLTPAEQLLHLAALSCVALAAALVMSPAALHRRTEPRSVSESVLRWSSHLLMWSMVPLAIGTSMDVYLIARLITGSRLAALGVSGGTFMIFAVLWFFLPMWFRRRR